MMVRSFVWNIINLIMCKLGGIGKLTDGIIGGDENNWISWNKSPVIMELQFDMSRHFKTIQIYTMNNKYESVEVKFDDNLIVKHQLSSMESSLSTVFFDKIQLSKYGNEFIGKRLQMKFEFWWIF